MLEKLLKDEKGSGIIILAIGLTVFLGFTAIVTDMGLVYLTNARLANAIDAAALAGAQELPYNPQAAIDIAKNYAEANGVEKDQITIELLNNNKCIKVYSEKEVTLFLAKTLGFNSENVSHTAMAEVAPIVGVNGASPLGIKQHDFIFGQEYTLKVGANDTSIFSEEISPGWFGALALGAPGADDYENNLTYNYSGNLYVGDIVDIQTGNISNPTKRAIDYRIAEEKHIPYCTVDHFERDCSRLLKVPVIEPVDSNSIRIVGFAMFLVDAVEGQGINNYLKGSFVRTIVSGEVDPNAQDFGLVGVRLVQ